MNVRKLLNLINSIPGLDTPAAQARLLVMQTSLSEVIAAGHGDCDYTMEALGESSPMFDSGLEMTWTKLADENVVHFVGTFIKADHAVHRQEPSARS